MRRPTALATIALTALAFAGTAALPAHASERPAAAASSVAPAADSSAPVTIKADKNVTVTVSMDKIGAGNAVADALRSIKTDDRGSFVKQASEKAFNASGGRHNVMLFNLSQGYDDRFQNIKIYANVKWGNVYYGLWIFENGEFTNTGDGGWINWGMYGWFERNGGHVKFNRSW
ncbi:stress protein [Streptomyces sp. NPDC054863]